MRAWVTGATGLCGSALVDRLVARGDEVTALVRPTSRESPLLHAWGSRVRVVLGELPELSPLPEEPAPEVVFHCAAVLPPGGLDAPARCRAVHVEGTDRLAALAGERGARLVHLSSTDVLSSEELDGPVDEEAACAPRDVYGWTKLEGEARVLSRAAAGLSAAILRPPGIYGPRSRGDAIMDMAQKIARHRFFHVGDGSARRSFVFVENLVDAMLHLAARPEATGVFNVDDFVVPTRRELAVEIARALGRAPLFPRVPLELSLIVGRVLEEVCGPLGVAPPFSVRSARFRSGSLVLQTDRLRATGFVPGVGLREAIERSVRWYREAGIV